MDTFEKINEIIGLCAEKKIKCHLGADSNNYEDKYVPLGESLYRTIKSWLTIGGGNLLKQEITELTEIWSKISRVKNEKDYAGMEKKFRAVLKGGENKVKSYNANEASRVLLPFIDTTESVYKELMKSDGYSNIDSATIEGAVALFASMRENIEKIVDGESRKAATYLEQVHAKIMSFRTNITSKNYINNRALEDANKMLEEWSTLEHVKDKPTKEMALVTENIKRRNEQKDEFKELGNINELRARCANLFTNLDEKYARVNNAAIDRLTGISNEMQEVTEQILKVQNDIKVRYKNAPPALRDSIKMTGFATLRPLEEKKKRLERELQKGIGKIDDPGVAAFNRFYDLMSGIRDIYNDCAEFEMSYFNMVFNPLLEQSPDGTTPFDVLNSMINSSRISEGQYGKIFQWINITVPVMKNSYYAACEMLSMDNDNYMREFNPEGLQENTVDLKERMNESMSFLDDDSDTEEKISESFDFEDFGTMAEDKND